MLRLSSAYLIDLQQWFKCKTLVQKVINCIGENQMLDNIINIFFSSCNGRQNTLEGTYKLEILFNIRMNKNERR